MNHNHDRTMDRPRAHDLSPRTYKATVLRKVPLTMSRSVVGGTTPRQTAPRTAHVAPAATHVAPAAFRRGFCDLCADPQLLASVVCCSCTATAQMYARVAHRPARCYPIALTLWATVFLGSVLMSVQNALHRGSVAFGLVSSAGILVGFAGTLVSTSALCYARRRQRVRDRIEEGCGGALSDCCESYWCPWCVLSQTMAQEGITSDTYDPWSPTAT